MSTGGPPRLAIGDVIQLGPASPWPFVYATVREVKLWGVIAEIPIPCEREKPPSVAPVRLAHGQFDRIGIAAYAWER